ncbi:MAG: amidohydrolase family protein [Candidatus Hodarchaeales archaeon]|jgi:imidazolonepropionase-like amidohydrolase
MKAIINGKIIDKKGREVERDVLISESKIKIVNKDLDVPREAEIIDATGKHVCPGFIDGHGHQGLWQGSIGAEGMDFNETSVAITPHLRAIDAINPIDPDFRDAVVGGVTAINTGPGSANILGGEFVLVKTAHDTIVVDNLVVRTTGIKAAFGENPKRIHGRDRKKEPVTRLGNAGMLRSILAEAESYMEELAYYEREYARFSEMGASKRIEPKPVKRDAVLEAAIRLLKRELPMHAHAHRADDIVTAIRICKEYKIDMVSIHTSEGHKIAPFLAKEEIPCIYGHPLFGRVKTELRDITWEAPRILAENGVEMCLQSDSSPPIQYFKILPMFAIRHGLDSRHAFRSVTIDAAKILGVEDRMGSIEPGKDADIVIWDGHPFDFNSFVDMTLINGKIEYQRDKNRPYRDTTWSAY